MDAVRAAAARHAAAAAVCAADPDRYRRITGRRL